MKKETALAIFIGLSLGLVITYGAYQARTALQKKPVKPGTSAQVASPQAVDSAGASVHGITLHNPQHGSVQKEKKTTVTGTTNPLQPVVLFVNDTEYIRQSDDAGTFSFDVPLSVGGNILTVVTNDSDNTMRSLERTVIVADLSAPEPTPTPTPQPKKASPTPKPKISASPSPSLTPTPTASSTANLNQRIEKALETLASQDTALSGFVGEVTRIAQNSITVKHDETSTILKINDGVSFRKKDKKVALPDVSVSNWVTVVGEKSDETFVPKLILVSDVSLRPKPKLVSIATVQDIKKQQLILVPRDKTQGEQLTLTSTKQTKFEALDGTALKLTDIQKDFTVLIVAQKQKDDDTDYVLTTVRSLATKTKK